MGLDIYFIKRKPKEIGYFRKVNFLVKFFEDKGMDVKNQKPFRIDYAQAEELLERCKIVLKNNSKASTILPTKGGDFFGDTKYNEYYFRDVARVKEFIETKLLSELNGEDEVWFEIWY